MNNWLWLIVGGVIVAALIEHNRQSTSQPLLPSIQPGGCLPGDPSITINGKTYCLPQGVIPY